MLSDALDQASLDTVFPEEIEICDQLETIAEMIKVKDIRGVDRDVFFASMFGWDHHASLLSNSEFMFSQLDLCIETFWDEMTSQGVQNNVVLVVTSEFGRSITPNSSLGTDHGWGGNYWIMGGKVNGGKILGKYPQEFHDALDIGRGRMIPTTSWDSIWNGIAQWMGVEDELLDDVMPNRHHFSDELYAKDDLFQSSAVRTRNLRS